MDFFQTPRALSISTCRKTSSSRPVNSLLRDQSPRQPGTDLLSDPDTVACELHSFPHPDWEGSRVLWIPPLPSFRSCIVLGSPHSSEARAQALRSPPPRRSWVLSTTLCSLGGPSRITSACSSYRGALLLVSLLPFCLFLFSE